MGYVNEKNLITVHRLSCKVAEKLKANHGNRIVEAKWNMNGTVRFPATIQIDGLDRIGVLNEITQIISTEHSVNIRKLVVESKEEMFNCTILMLVRNLDEVNRVIKSLKAIENVGNVTRI